MVLDLYMLTEQATGGAEPPFSKYLAASLIPFMVLFGGFYRFWANEIRGSPSGALRGAPVGCCQAVIGVLSFAAACAIFAVVVWGILDPLIADTCPPGVNATDVASGTCPITDEHGKTDESAVFLLTLTWLGYPVVSLTSRFLQSCASKDTGTQYSGYISTGKDFAYAVLDLTSKAGLALYVAFRTTWR